MSIQKVPECSAISQLPPLFGAGDADPISGDNTLFLVSQKEPLNNSEVDYLSKSVTAKQLEKHFGNLFGISSLWEGLRQKADLAGLSTDGMLSANVETPYILSSFQISVCAVTAVGGYPLRDGLRQVMDENGYVPDEVRLSISYDNQRNTIRVGNASGRISSEISVNQFMGSYVTKTDYDELSNTVKDISSKYDELLDMVKDLSSKVLTIS